MQYSWEENNKYGQKRTRKTLFANLMLFDVANYAVMAVMLVLTIYPFVNIVAISFNDAGDAASGHIYLWPRVFSLGSYTRIFNSTTLLNAAFVTVIRTVIGTAASVFCCAVLAYPLSKRKLVGQKYYFMYFIFSMLFSGGLVPIYMVYRWLGLIDKFIVYIIPGLINVVIMLLIMMFFREIPLDIEESAKVDGVGDFSIFLRIYIPMSMPCIATVSLFYAVGHWNSWFDSMIFTSRRELKVMQLILQSIITQSQATILEDARNAKYNNAVSPDTVKAAITVVTTAPIIMVYPFLQKYFTKGMIVGAIKG